MYGKAGCLHTCLKCNFIVVFWFIHLFSPFRREEGREGVGKEEERECEGRKREIREERRKGWKGEVTSMISVPVIQHFSPQDIEI